MLLGLVADIHEAVGPLALALARFRDLGVEQVVNLGDAFDRLGPGSRPVADLMTDCGAVGVWGNHDYGLCGAVSEPLRVKAGERVIAFMSGMRPQVTLDGCRFSHVEPWLDPNQVEDLWYYDGPPESAGAAGRSFAAHPERFFFVGHFHCWLAVTPAGRLDWDGSRPLDLASVGRALVVVAPVAGGWAATFDTRSATLTPVWCG
ncbi:MAG: metallophosphoesterase family protein [Gemmataceae bacterium]